MLPKNSSARLAFVIMAVATGVFLIGDLLFRTLNGTCLRTESLTEFDVAKFKGVWYELQRDKDISFESGECVTAQYGDDSRGVSVENTEYFPATDSKIKINGFALASTFRNGLIEVYFFFFPADYRVIATDYTSYAIVYSCTMIGPIKYPEFSWLLTRN